LRNAARLVSRVVGWVHIDAFLIGCTARETPVSGTADGLAALPIGPVLSSPISIKLGQSLVRANGSVGPTDGPQGSPAIWEGHAVTLEPDADRTKTVYFFVEGIDLNRVTLQVDDQVPILEERPGIYLSGEISMVRWAQEYSVRVTAEDSHGTSVTSTIFVTGEDARVEGKDEERPLRMQMLRMGPTDTIDLRGVGYRGKMYRHRWPACSTDCDLTAPGGVLVAMVSGPTDTLLLLFEGKYPYIATGLGSFPAPHIMIVAIPVREESSIEIAAVTGRGEVAMGRWDKPA
jgi:hypothetical protein